jgi:hypothetical protein
VDKLTDEERHARVLITQEIIEKIKNEYGNALAALGKMPVLASIRSYTAEEHAEFARQRGVNLDVNALNIQRDYLDLLSSASASELHVVVRTLDLLLTFNRLAERADYANFINEVISVLSFAETTADLKESIESRRSPA